MVRSLAGAGWAQQSALLTMPVDARALLPDGHAAFAFMDLLQQLDMSALLGAYRADGRGRPPFDPRSTYLGHIKPAATYWYYCLPPRN